MKFAKFLYDNFEEIFLVFFLAVIACIMMLQIIMRKFFSSMIWPEEFCRYCYVWTVFLSLGYTIRKGNMLRVGIVIDSLPEKVKKIAYILVDVLLAAIFAVFFVHAAGYTKNVYEMGQRSSAMRIPMWTMYCATVVGFGLAVIRAVESIVRSILHFNETVETEAEPAQKAAEGTSATQKANRQGGGVA